MGKKVKRYCLYLDESGNFLEDPGDKEAPPSLVGGVFGEASVFSKEKARAFLAQLANDPELQAMSPGCPLAVNHCEELPDGLKVPVRLRVIRWCVHQGMEFVFFQSDVKVQIVDSTRTYLNFLAEGLIDLLAHLSYRGDAKLTVCIGRRVDTAAYEQNPRMGKQSIREEEYRNLIQARIAIARARRLFDETNQISCEITFDRDKDNDFLVLSDYVCSCRYTLGYTGGPTWKDYEQPADDGRSRRTVLEEIFQDRGRRFGLSEGRLQKDVRRSLSNRDWGDALFLALSQGEPDQDMEAELQESFQSYDDHGQRTQMDLFFHLVSHLLHARDSTSKELDSNEVASCLLEAYLRFLDRLPMGMESLRSFCRVNARMYLGTAYNHRGLSGLVKEQLDRCEEALPELLGQQENMDLYYILRNRQAILWQDCFCYDKALKVLDDTISVAQLQQESHRSLIGLLVSDARHQPSVQQAKLLGSWALTYQYMLPTHPELAQEAQDAARQVIQAMQLPQDKQRHYMTLAEIEVICGQLDDACQHFCAGLDCDPDNILEALGQCKKDFDWYHAIRLADGLSWGNKPEHRALAEKLFALIHRRFGTVFGQSYPAHSAARRMALLCLKQGKAGARLAQEYFQKCEVLCFKPGQDTFYVIGLASMAEHILADLRNGKRVDQLERQFHERCTRAEKWAQIPELQALFHELAHGSESSADKKKFYQSVSNRVGH